MKKLLVLGLLLTTILVGCGSSKKETVTVCTQELGGISYSVTYKAEGDKVTSMEQVSVTDSTGSGYTAEQIEEMLQSYADNYNAMTGVSYNYTFEDEILTETILVDFNKTSNSDLIALAILSASDADVDYISLDMTVKSLESQGITCKLAE